MMTEVEKLDAGLPYDMTDPAVDGRKLHAVKMTAFLCHGPIASLAALDDAAGYRHDALQIAGGTVVHAPLAHGNVVRDRELITGQNPSSDHMIAEAMVNALNEQQADK